MLVLRALDRLLQDQRGYLFPWVPVWFGCGICLYFALDHEPVWRIYAVVLLGSIAAAWVWRRQDGLGMICAALCLIGLGFCHMGARAHWVAEQVLPYRYYGAVEGQVVHVDRSAADAPRVTLASVRLDGVAPHHVPGRVRLSLMRGTAPLPGAWVMTTAHLSPPPGPAEPGGFDFRRHAWFQRIGAVGYTRLALLETAPPEALPIATFRAYLSQWVRDAMPPRTGGVATALITGDRAHVPQAVTDALRASNLAHLLAISGLHMGLFAGVVFGGMRRAAALWPWLALHVPVKKTAAACALVCAFGYLLISGGNVATERAFVMVSVMLVAVLLDRRALSIRAVALAALIVLMRRPETLLSPGFHMSFAATLALVAVFNALRDNPLAMSVNRSSAAVSWLISLCLSSLVAGLATAPYGAAHFNSISSYGLVANLLAVPMMGSVVVPAAVLALCLAPLGASWIGFWLMSQGISWILSVAETVSRLPGARSYVATPQPWVLPALSLCCLFLILWQGRFRWLACLALTFVFVSWSTVERPEVLLSDDGGLVGVMTPAGRALSRPSGKGFVAQVWLQNDGDRVSQAAASSRWPGVAEGKVQQVQALGLSFVHVIGKTGQNAWQGCAKGQVIVASVEMNLPGECLLLTPKRLRETGSLAFYADGRMVQANDPEKQRLWSAHSRQRSGE